jgi:hypothetical protein
MLEPIEPELRIEREPIPSFTNRVHVWPARCSKGHVFSAGEPELRMAYFFGGPNLGSDLPDGHEADHLCPDCERDSWAESTRTARLDHSAAMGDYRRDKRRWEELEEHESIEGWGAF